MNNLKEIYLKDCIELFIDHRGKTPSKMGGDWTNNGIKVISALNVHNGVIDNVEQIRYVSQEIYKKWMSIDIQRNDCFIVSEGASLGENCIWDSDEKIVLGQRLYAIRTNPQVLDPWYFAFYMQTAKFRLQIDQISTGSTVFGISQPILLNLKLLIPDLYTQKEIGLLYKSIYSKIENNNKINSELESIAKTLYDYWFLQFEFPNEEGKPYKSSGGKMVWNEELKREIPENWIIVKFKEILEFKKGKIPTQLFDSKIEDTDKYLTIDVVNGGVPQYCYKYNLPYCNGETVMVMDGAASGDVYVGNKGILGSTFSMITSKNKSISNSMVHMLLKEHAVIYKKANTGSTVPHANKNFIENMAICIPKNLSYFSDTFDKIQNLINKNREENQELTSLRDFLLPLLMNGQVGFKED